MGNVEEGQHEQHRCARRSPDKYIGADLLRNGLNLGHAAVLVGVTLVLLAIGLFAFERRDVGV